MSRERPNKKFQRKTTGKNPTSSATGSFLRLDSSTRIISLYGPLPQAQTCRLIALCPSITSKAGAVGPSNYDGTASLKMLIYHSLVMYRWTSMVELNRDVLDTY